MERSAIHKARKQVLKLFKEHEKLWRKNKREANRLDLLRKGIIVAAKELYALEEQRKNDGKHMSKSKE